MASFTKQVLKDTTTETVVKFIGFIDAAANLPQTLDQANSTLAMASLRGAYDTNNALRSVTGNAALSFYGTNIRKVNWTIAATPANAAIQLSWRGGGSNANVVAFNFCGGAGELDFTDGTTAAVAITDPGVGLGANSGDLIVTATPGLTAATYTIIVALKKDPKYFDRGALVDKAYFQNP